MAEKKGTASQIKSMRHASLSALGPIDGAMRHASHADEDEVALKRRKSRMTVDVHTNHEAMLELFNSGAELTVSVGSAVTVPFDMFVAVQKRMTFYAGKLDEMKELYAASQVKNAEGRADVASLQTRVRDVTASTDALTARMEQLVLLTNDMRNERDRNATSVQRVQEELSGVQDHLVKESQRRSTVTLQLDDLNTTMGAKDNNIDSLVRGKSQLQSQNRELNRKLSVALRQSGKSVLSSSIVRGAVSVLEADEDDGKPSKLTAAQTTELMSQRDHYVEMSASLSKSKATNVEALMERIEAAERDALAAQEQLSGGAGAAKAGASAELITMSRAEVSVRDLPASIGENPFPLQSPFNTTWRLFAEGAKQMHSATELTLTTFGKFEGTIGESLTVAELQQRWADMMPDWRAVCRSDAKRSLDAMAAAFAQIRRAEKTAVAGIMREVQREKDEQRLHVRSIGLTASMPGRAAECQTDAVVGDELSFDAASSIQRDVAAPMSLSSKRKKSIRMSGTVSTSATPAASTLKPPAGGSMSATPVSSGLKPRSRSSSTKTPASAALTPGSPRTKSRTPASAALAPDSPRTAASPRTTSRPKGNVGAPHVYNASDIVLGSMVQHSDDVDDGVMDIDERFEPSNADGELRNRPLKASQQQRASSSARATLEMSPDEFASFTDARPSGQADVAAQTGDDWLVAAQAILARGEGGNTPAAGGRGPRGTPEWCYNMLIPRKAMTNEDAVLFARLPEKWFELHNVLHRFITVARKKFKVSMAVPDVAPYVGDGHERCIADVHCAMRYDVSALEALLDLLEQGGGRAKLLAYSESIRQLRMHVLDEQHATAAAVARLGMAERAELLAYRAQRRNNAAYDARNAATLDPYHHAAADREDADVAVAGTPKGPNTPRGSTTRPTSQQNGSRPGTHLPSLLPGGVGEWQPPHAGDDALSIAPPKQRAGTPQHHASPASFLHKVPKKSHAQRRQLSPMAPAGMGLLMTNASPFATPNTRGPDSPRRAAGAAMARARRDVNRDALPLSPRAAAKRQPATKSPSRSNTPLSPSLSAWQQRHGSTSTGAGTLPTDAKVPAPPSLTARGNARSHARQ
jgi:hypothetical protein